MVVPGGVSSVSQTEESHHLAEGQDQPVSAAESGLRDGIGAVNLSSGRLLWSSPGQSVGPARASDILQDEVKYP